MASVTISFNLAPNVSLGAATDRGEAASRGRSLPATITGGFSGTAQAFQDSQQGLGMLLLITIFVIYIILGILYESFIHPITILTGLPFAAFGALFALYCHARRARRVRLRRHHHADRHREEERDHDDRLRDRAAAQRAHARRREAIIEAASVRFRPIMMTTVSAIVGTLPIAIGVGASAASRRPLGIAVVGGFAFSQIVTLYVTPVFYTYFDELQTWLGRRATRTARPRADRRACRRRLSVHRPAASCQEPVAVHESHDAVHQAPGHDDARHDRDSRLRHRRVPAAAGERSAERRLPDDHGQRDAAGHEPADDGGDGRDAARESSSRRSPASTT